MRKAVVEKENRSFLTGSYLSFSLPKETATLELRIVIREKNRSESGTREMKRAREKGKSFDLVLSKRGTKRRRLTRSKNSPPVLARHISLCDSRRRVTSVNGNIRPHYQWDLPTIQRVFFDFRHVGYTGSNQIIGLTPLDHVDRISWLCGFTVYTAELFDFTITIFLFWANENKKIKQKISTSNILENK